MGGPFDVLASADFLVPDRDAAVAMMQRVIGIGEPKPRWSHGGPGAGHRVTFCRAHPVVAQSPTLIELIEPASVDPTLPLGAVVPNVAGLADLQSHRTLKTHGAPVASSNVEELIDDVRSRGLRHWVQPSLEGFPYLRLWMGITGDDLAGYEPSTDGGLMLEVVDTATLGLPPEAADPPREPDADDTAGGMVRTTARVFVVDDVDRSVATLAKTFSWEPECGIERGVDGPRRAVLGFTFERSARVELLEPAAASPDGALLQASGPGIGAVRIGVRDLAAKADDLRSRGTTFTVVPTGFDEPAKVLRVDPSATPHCLFEFAEV